MNIEIENLNKSFGDKKVLDNLSLTIHENETLCLMAKSGFGKTTLINILLGILEKDSGKISGIENKKISVVFQEDRLFENLTVYSNLKFVLEKEYSKEFFENELKSVGLENVLFEKVENLSFGMKRRVAIVRALLFDFQVIFMDEPFKGLDVETKEKVILYIKSKTENKIALIITHDETDAKLLNANIKTF